MPSIARSRAPARRRASTRAGRACTDAAAAEDVAHRPCSTMRPAYMTATRSAVSAIDAEIVRDEQQRQVERRLHLAQQIEDLRLNRDVERRRRLVGDDQRRAGTRAPSRSARAAACRRTAGADSRATRRAASGMRTASSSSMAVRARVAASSRGRARAASRRSGRRR